MDKDEHGAIIVTDITLGLRMAQRPAFSLGDALGTVIDFCGKCQKEMAKGGDNIILKDRSGPKAIYWCRDCEKEEFQKISNRPLSGHEFRRISAAASGRSHLTATQIAKSALFKLAKSLGQKTDHVTLDSLRVQIAKA